MILNFTFYCFISFVAVDNQWIFFHLHILSFYRLCALIQINRWKEKKKSYEFLFFISPTQPKWDTHIDRDGWKALPIKIPFRLYPIFVFSWNPKESQCSARCIQKWLNVMHTLNYLIAMSWMYYKWILLRTTIYAYRMWSTVYNKQYANNLIVHAASNCL